MTYEVEYQFKWDGKRFECLAIKHRLSFLDWLLSIRWYKPWTWKRRWKIMEKHDDH